MSKVISFSFWGEDPKYLVGAVKNAQLAAELFPDWSCYFYIPSHRDPVLKPYVQQIYAANECAYVFETGLPADWRGMFWRFLPINQADVVIIRDTDSRLSLREKAAVDEWVESDKGCHIMRDHPWHSSEILGGMWGMKRDTLPEFGELMRAWDQEDRWQTDQDFLKSMVYPRVSNNAMIHADFFSLEAHAKRFPMERDGLEFVGQIFDENDIVVAEHQAMLKKALR